MGILKIENFNKTNICFELCNVLSLNIPKVKAIIGKIGNAWDDFLDEKKKAQSDYFGIKIVIDNEQLGVVVRRDNLYLQGIYNCESDIAYVLNETISYPVLGDRNSHVSIEKIKNAVINGNKLVKDSKNNINEKEITTYLNSMDFEWLIFVIAEAARFESIRVATILGVVLENCDDKWKADVLKTKQLYNISEFVNYNDYTLYSNYDCLKKSYSGILEGAKDKAEFKNDYNKGYASIKMSQDYVFQKYCGQQDENKANHRNQYEMNTYYRIGLLQEK